MDDASTKQAETVTNDRDFTTGFVLYDRYEIQKALGAGGFAVVYSAFDRTIERQVAIKVLNIYSMVGSQKETDEVLQRFLREARVAAKIRHPSSIEIYDFGLLEGGQRPYIIMEFLKGWDLDQELQENGPLSSELLFPLFCGALDALAEAHEKGVIHKDLKPANLFRSRPHTEHETLKVVDFGIAHVNAPGKERLTQTGVMSGTPEYLPPEYIEDQLVTEMMDIYQMGLTLVEALSGVPVVQAASPYQAAFKHVEGDLNIPPEFQEGAFGELLERALAIDPEDRFSTAHEFSQALAAIDPSTVLLASMADTQRVEGFPSPVMNEDGVWEDGELSTGADIEQSSRIVVAEDAAGEEDSEDTLIEAMTEAEKEVVDAAVGDGQDLDDDQPDTLEEGSFAAVDDSPPEDVTPEKGSGDTLVDPMTEAEKEVVEAASDGESLDETPPDTLEEKDNFTAADDSPTDEETPQEDSGDTLVDPMTEAEKKVVEDASGGQNSDGVPPKTLEDASFSGADDGLRADSEATQESTTGEAGEDDNDNDVPTTMDNEVVSLEGNIEGNSGVKIEQDALFGAEKRDNEPSDPVPRPNQTLPSTGISQEIKLPPTDDDGDNAESSSSKLLVAAVISVGIMIILSVLVILTLTDDEAADTTSETESEFVVPAEE